MSEEEYREFMGEKLFKKSKYNAVIVERDGYKFDSKKEAKYFDELLLRVKAKEVLFFLRQVPFHLPGKVVYRLDFLEFHPDGSVHFVEVKGFDTPMGKLKRKQTEELYPVKIEVV